MRFFGSLIFVLFNVYLIESANRTESEKNSQGRFDSDKSGFVPGGVEERKSEQEEVLYEEYEYLDSRENSISGKNEKSKGNATDSSDSVEGFPNEVFLSLRNITADAATAFRSFTNRNDVVDLQASASDNLNVTVNNTFGDAESAGINLRILRDAGHPPQIIGDGGGELIHLPYKHTKIDTADLSDCALQGEWKPMGVAHGHLHVDGDHSNAHQVEVLQSVGTYAVPNKVIPLWQQNHFSGGAQALQDGTHNHKPSGLYSSGAAGGSYGAGFGYGSGFQANGLGGSSVGVHIGLGHRPGGGGGISGSGLGQFQKIKSASMLSPPPIPPIVFGKKPGYWKLGKTKHKFFPGKGRRPGAYGSGGSYGFSSHSNHAGSGFSNGGGYSGAAIMSGYVGHGGSGYGVGSGGGGSVISGVSGHSGGEGGVLSEVIKGGAGYGGGGGGGSGHKGHGFDSGAIGGLSVSGNTGHGYNGGAVGGFSTSGGLGHGFGGGNAAIISLSEGSSGLGHGGQDVGGGTIGEHVIGGSGVLGGGTGSESGVGVEEELSGGQGYVGGDQVISGNLVTGSGLGSAGGEGVLVVGTSGLSGGAVGGENLRAEAAFLTAELVKPSGNVGGYGDSSFSSTHLNQGLRGANSLPDATFLSSHISQDFANHGQGVSDDLSSSSTFTCGKNHDHNTNYHTATFQVADHDHPSSVDVLQYGGDAAVLIQSGDASFHDQVLPERKHYKTSHLSDAEVSGSDNRNELITQAAKLTSDPTEEVGQIESDPTKIDDGEEPERHSYYHEITKVTKIPATSVGSVQYTYSQYETKPQTFSTESDALQEEPEAEPPQIIRELEHLSNKFQLDLENPQKLFDDPPSQELSYHYPFQDGENHQHAGKPEGAKEEAHGGVSEFPYQFYHNYANKPSPQPVIYNKPPKYIPRPGKPHFYQKTTLNYLQPKPPLIVVRKHKPKHFLRKKQNYDVREHGGERHRPIGEIFPPQKFPKQFHNPKPNFAVDRPKNGWRPDVQEYKYEHSHGKKVRKYNTKAKLVAPVLIRRPVSPAPVIRVVEVSG